MFLEVKGGDRTSVKMQDGHQTGILSLLQFIYKINALLKLLRLCTVARTVRESRNRWSQIPILAQYDLQCTSIETFLNLGFSGSNSFPSTVMVCSFLSRLQLR